MPTPQVQDALAKVQRELRWLIEVVGVLSPEELRHALEDIDRKITGIRGSID